MTHKTLMNNSINNNFNILNNTNKELMKIFVNNNNEIC